VPIPFRGLANGVITNYRSCSQAFEINGVKITIPAHARSLASRASDSVQQSSSQLMRKGSGLGIAAAAGYAVFKELIFQPKEYKIFGKALDRVQNDSQVRVRIGSPITGYGQETRNRAACQRIPNRTWTDEDGSEHVQVNFYIRGPHGAGKVSAEMVKDKVDKKWKYIYLIVEIRSPSPAQLLLESYVPA
ncbi:hypothetical protein MIMGU_mgv1a019727mg, partial [Erythranthe guttata]